MICNRLWSEFITFQYLNRYLLLSLVLRPPKCYGQAYLEALQFEDALYSLSFLCTNWPILIILNIACCCAKVGGNTERNLEGPKPAVLSITNIISTHIAGPQYKQTRREN